MEIWLTIGAFCGAFMGVVAVGTWLWKNIGKPLKIRMDAAAELIEYELNTNGGASIKDRIRIIDENTAKAVEMAAEAATESKKAAQAVEEHRTASREALEAHLEQSMEEHSGIRRELVEVKTLATKAVENTGGS